MPAETTRKRIKTFSDYFIFGETKNVPEFENTATQIKTYCSLMKYCSIYSFIQPLKIAFTMLEMVIKFNQGFENRWMSIERKSIWTVCVITPQTQDVNWTYIRRSENVQDVFWTSYVRSIYVLYLQGNECYVYCFSLRWSKNSWNNYCIWN